MSDGDVIELPVRRHDDAVRAVDVDRHVACGRLALNARAIRSEPHERDLVGAFRDDIKEIILVGF